MTSQEVEVALPRPPVAAVDAARTYIRHATAEGTRAVYGRLFAAFTAWCERHGLASLPATPDIVAAYLASEAERGVAPASVKTKRAAIAAAHRAAGLDPPTGHPAVRLVIAGIRRSKGVTPAKKAPLTAPGALGTVLGAIPTGTLLGLRDRALLLLGFAAALRRSELVALRVEDLEETNHGLLVTIRRSKTDQSGEGQVVAVPRSGALCPVRAVRAWQEAAGVAEGALFRAVSRGDRAVGAGLCGRSVARVVQRRVAAVGLDPARFAGHSLRAGFLTSAARAGASVWKMAEVSRHASLDVLKGYVRATELFDDHAGNGLL